VSSADERTMAGRSAAPAGRSVHTAPRPTTMAATTTATGSSAATATAAEA
jgi:hypothetical protein